MVGYDNWKWVGNSQYLYTMRIKRTYMQELLLTLGIYP